MLALTSDSFPQEYIIAGQPGNGANGVQNCPLRARLHSLSPRQKEAVEMAGRGMMDKSIAAEMGIDELTVKQHVRIAMKRLGVSRRIMLAPLAVSAGKKVPLDLSRLTQAHLRVADLIADGLTDEDIATRLGLSVANVKAAIRAIRAACGGGTRTTIAIAALHRRQINGGR